MLLGVGITAVALYFARRADQARTAESGAVAVAPQPPSARTTADAPR